MEGWTYDPVKGWMKGEVTSNLPPSDGTAYWYKDSTGKWVMKTFYKGDPEADPTAMPAGTVGSISTPTPDPKAQTTIDGAPVPPVVTPPVGSTPPPAAPPAASQPLTSTVPKPGYEYIGGGIYALIPKTTSVSALRPGDESRQGATIWNVGEDGIQRPEQVVTRDANGRHANEATPNTPATRGKITGWTSGAGETNGYVPSSSAPTEEQYNQSHGVSTIDRLLLDGDPATRGRTSAYDSMSDLAKNTISRQLVNSVEDVARTGGNVVADGVVRQNNTDADRAKFILNTIDLVLKDPGRYDTGSYQKGGGATDPISIAGNYWDSMQAGNQKPLQGREQRAKDKKAAAMNSVPFIERVARGTLSNVESSPGQIDTTGWTGKGSGYDAADYVRQRRGGYGTVPPGENPPQPPPPPRPPVLGNIPDPAGGWIGAGSPVNNDSEAIRPLPMPSTPPRAGYKWALGDNGQWTQIPQDWEMTWGGPRPRPTGSTSTFPPPPPPPPTSNTPRPQIPMPTRPDGTPAYPEGGSVGGWGWKWNGNTGQWESNLPTPRPPSGGTRPVGERPAPPPPPPYDPTRPGGGQGQRPNAGGAGSGQGSFRYW